MNSSLLNSNNSVRSADYYSPPPFFFVFSMAAPAAYGRSQASGLFGAVSAGLHHSHSIARAEPLLRPTSQLTATPDP